MTTPHFDDSDDFEDFEARFADADSREGSATSIRQILDTLTQEASLRDTGGFAPSWHILMEGAILLAMDGHDDAALQAREMATDLILRHRPTDARARASAPMHAAGFSS